MIVAPVCPLRLKKGVETAVVQGMPWVYASDIIASSELMLIPAGSIVKIENHKGQGIGIGYYNAASQIACRVLTLQNEPIDTAFFVSRLQRAITKRDALIGMPYYRLLHSESDGLPGLLMDRFGDMLVVQTGTAGMEQLQPLWLAAIEQLLAPHTIVLRNDASARVLEGLKKEVRVIKGTVPERLEVWENDCCYFADLVHGQKTGWFYDQRDNRRMIAERAKGKTLIDIYSHSGGFGVLAAKKGAAQVCMVDSSKLALELAREACERNAITVPCEFQQGDAFDCMEQLAKQGRTFDIVLADPPAFVKSKKDIASGLKGYEKVTRLATALVAPGGELFVASCSHHAGRSAFNKAVLDGIAKAGRKATILKQTGASADHPRHPLLAQSEYLKGIVLKMED